ncbi:MAG: TonB-dependent receptor, partial [Alphaproteobacteria bacterium]
MEIRHPLLNFVLFSALGIGAQAARAQDAVLDDIVVTAGREPVASEAVGRAHTLITGAQLERSGSRSVADALRQVPGLAVSRTGGIGGFTQIRIRGAEANHLLVLIDGVEVSEVGSGEFDFGALAATDIERIEVLRGPQSALWGSNAQAGVISIITKAGRRNSLEYGGRAESGSDATRIATAYLRGGRQRYDFAFSGISRRTDGFNISSFGGEKDGDENITLNFKGNADVTPSFRLDGTARYVNRKTDTDAQDFAFPPTPTQGLVIDSDDQTRSRELFGGTGLTVDMFGGRLTHQARLKAGDVTRKTFSNRTRSSGSTGRRYHASYQLSARIETPAIANARHAITGAVESERETFRQLEPVFDPSQLAERSRTLTGVIGEYRGSFFDRLHLSAALRHDDNDNFEDATTYALSGALLLPGSGTRIHASVGTGVTNPTFFEQFGFIPAFFQGNPNLRPESSFAWDAGIEHPFLGGRLTVDVTHFRQRIEDEIATRFTGGFTTPVNLTGTSRSKGIEVSLRAEATDALGIKGSYT